MNRATRHVALLCALLCPALSTCRSVPVSGTPLSDGEDLDKGVQRQHHVYGARRATLTASGEKLARDIAALLEVAGRAEPPRIFLADPRNYTSLPYGSFSGIQRQLWAELKAAGQRAGIEFVEEVEEEGSGETLAFDYVLYADLLSFEPGQDYVVSYELISAAGDRQKPRPKNGILWSGQYVIDVP